MVVEGFAEHDGVKIRYLDNDPDQPSGFPVVLVPGIVDFAHDYLDAFGCFGHRRLVVVDLRGRGGSDAPGGGYSALDQAGDVLSVLAAAGIGRFHLMTFSRGTTAGLEAAFAVSERVLSVSIGDYLPAEIGLTARSVEAVWSSTWRGVANSSRVARHVLEAIAADSRSRELWADLAGLAVPVLVAAASQRGVVDGERAARYRREVPGVEVITIPGSGHDIFRPSRTAYPEAVLEFISRRLPGT